mmetsp:Transcript_14798/g.39271  ORF Transcript_14798/g.39271 Transcript_14798/m.39271 type:complete len:725 (+) Transcript_14798:81-2255(+)
MKLHLSPYNVSPSAWSLASITSASNTCCLPRVFTPRQHSTTPCLLRSAGSGSATLDVAPTTQTQQQYKQYQQQQQQQQWHLPTRSISERDTLDTHADFAAPNHEDDIDQLQLLQRELEGYRATTTRELAHLQQQDAEGTAGPSKRRASTSALSLRSSSSSSSSSTFSEPSTSSSSPAPISRKRLGARSRSTSTLQLGSPTSFASSTKRSQNRQQHHGQQPATATSPSTSSSNSALRNSRRALLGDVAQATPSADSVHSSERRARLLSRAEEVMLATVARDGVHIEKVAKQLASILKRQPDLEELARAMKSEPWELEQRKQASLAARRMLLQANRGLVAKVVNQVNSYQHGRRNNCLSFEDSMEAGMAGMLKAILKFEPESGFKLSTYAVNWIRQELTRAQAQADLIRVPEHFRVEAGQLLRAQAELHSQKQQKPTDEEVCRALGWSRHKFVQVNQAALMKHAAAQAMSLESSLDDESAHNLDATMSLARTNSQGENGWKFSSGGTTAAEVEREEQLARDMEALLEQVVHQPHTQQAQHNMPHTAPAAEQPLSPGASTTASAINSMRARKPGRKSKRELQAAQAAAPAAGVAAAPVVPDAGTGSEEQGQEMLQEGLSPLHVEILRLRLGLMAGREQAWGDDRVKELTKGVVRPRRDARATPKSLKKRARAQEVLEQQAAQGKVVSVHSIATKFGMTPRRVQQAEREALQWLHSKCSGQVSICGPS